MAGKGKKNIDSGAKGKSFDQELMPPPALLGKKGGILGQWVRSLAFKMFIQTSSILIVFSLVVVLFVQIFIANFQSARIKADCRRIALSVCDRLMKDADEEQDEELTDEEKEALLVEFNTLVQSNGIIMYVFADGNVRELLFYNEDMTRYNNMREISATEDGSTKTGITGSYFTKEYRGVAYVAYGATIKGYYIEVLDNQTRRESVTMTTANLMQNIVLIGAGLALIWSFWNAGNFTRPIKQMSKVTKSMSLLNFKSRCAVGAKDELGELEANIKEMSYKLKGTLDELSTKNEQLTTELEKAHHLDEMRKKFVSDVSHELKTPLSIIYGYSEAMQIAAAKNNPASLDKAVRYSEAIMEESKKMERLLLDLLNLSLYESGTYTLIKSVFDIKQLCEELLGGYERIFSEQNIRIETDIESYSAEADNIRIAQIISNYLNNAITHVSGSRIIRLSGRAEGGRYRFGVFNTGSHIDEEDMGRIWTSFYRADKSRQREQGHFGIGLSIVRALVELHGGECGAVNVPGGVEFYFVI